MKASDGKIQTIESVTKCNRLKLEAADGKKKTEPVTKCHRLKMVAEDGKILHGKLND
jgi:hypothetical protein